MLTAAEIRDSLECYFDNGTLPSITQEAMITVTNWHMLVVMLSNEAVDSKSYVLAEERLTELLPSILPIITTWHELVDIWEVTTAESADEKLVESRMVAVLFDINNWHKLITMLVNCDDTHAPYYLIESRLMQMIRGVTCEKVPEWFSFLLDREYACPLDLLVDLRKKAKELRQGLSG